MMISCKETRDMVKFPVRFLSDWCNGKGIQV